MRGPISRCPVASSDATARRCGIKSFAKWVCECSSAVGFLIEDVVAVELVGQRENMDWESTVESCSVLRVEADWL